MCMNSMLWSWEQKWLWMALKAPICPLQKMSKRRLRQWCICVPSKFIYINTVFPCLPGYRNSTTYPMWGLFVLFNSASPWWFYHHCNLCSDVFHCGIIGPAVVGHKWCIVMLLKPLYTEIKQHHTVRNSYHHYNMLKCFKMKQWK